jgi:hypothetical protein
MKCHVLCDVTVHCYRRFEGLLLASFSRSSRKRSLLGSTPLAGPQILHGTIIVQLSEMTCKLTHSFQSKKTECLMWAPLGPTLRLYQRLHQCKKPSELQNSIISLNVVWWSRFLHKSITQPSLHKVMNSHCQVSYTKEMWLKFHRGGFHHKLSGFSNFLRTDP